MNELYADFFDTLKEATKKAELTGETANMRMLANYLVDNDPAYAEEIIQRANEIEDEHDTHYDQWVDNNAPRD